ncbi:beta-fimbriae major subunit [Yersinia massiliensis]|uniref:DUF1120 domain-containing protein n=1 Tax=Yersinia massiliensis TaxID=419257 RepID=UPI0005DDA0B0|nr:DUF1120 domain-containing protein [Yersinia massiliensis]CNI37502.1 beta-fimbriae major subunit [Yersinia massiliensis]
MKTQLIGLMVLSSLVLGMTTVHAAPPTAELKVKGKLGVPTCNIIAPDGGIYDLGKISATKVKSGATVTALTPMTKNWSVSCDSQTYLSLTTFDNRHASASDSSSANNYGLGLINGSGKIGYYTLVMSNPIVDGVKTTIFSLSSTGTMGSADLTSLTLAAIAGHQRSWSVPGTTTQKAGRVFSADLTINPTLAGTTTMNGPITEDTNIDGSTTINFAFSI